MKNITRKCTNFPFLMRFLPNKESKVGSNDSSIFSISTFLPVSKVNIKSFRLGSNNSFGKIAKYLVSMPFQ